MFKVGDVVEYIGDAEAQPKSEMLMRNWYPPNYREGFYVIESIRLADEDDCSLKTGCEVYKIYVRGTTIVPSNHYKCVVHVTDMYWDFELRKV